MACRRDSDRLRGEHGNVQIGLIVGPSSARRARSLTIVLQAARCGAARRCVRLAGTLRGALNYEPVRIPDAGARLRPVASGKIRPIG
ncbi:MAG TPA: hypothetical protein VKU89_02695 [Solirubrobacteraceae bacterium]|nr:hypothetical protein [Solirubrobacteraceae bacterium]